MRRRTTSAVALRTESGCPYNSPDQDESGSRLAPCRGLVNAGVATMNTNKTCGRGGGRRSVSDRRAVARAAGDEKTITGVISGVNPTTRIATVTPASGPPIVVQFAFNAGGPCTPVLDRAGPGPRSPKPSPRARRGRSPTRLSPGGCGRMVPGWHRQHGAQGSAVKPK